MVNQAPSLTSGNGTVTTDFGSRDASARSVVVQVDGKIVVTGYASGPNINSELVRYNADGSLDTSFGSGGIISSGPDSATGSGVALQTDGKIVVAGGAFGNSNDFAVARYNSDGSADASFGTGGKVVTHFGTSGSYGVAIQPDGKIVLTGYAGGDVAVARYNTDGSRDQSFGTGGGVTTDFGGSFEDAGYSLLSQPDGKIVIAGITRAGDYNFALARYNNDGTLDATFGAGGKVTTDFASADNIAYSVTLQPDGKILASGVAGNDPNSDLALVRYNADGSLDATFGTGGRVKTDLGGSFLEAAEGVKVQPDGKIVVAGFTLFGSPLGANFVVVRYNSDGSLDSSFGSGGKVRTSFGSNHEEANSLFIQPDGKIVVVGVSGSGPSPGPDFALARYNSDGSLDTSFGAGAVLGGTAAFTEGGSPTVLNGGAAVHDAELAAAGSYAGASLTLARHGGANAQDVFGASGHLAALTQGSNLVLSGVAIGTVTQNASGMLVLTFGAGATEARVNEAMRDITYANNSDNPAASAQIDWLFSDGNAGAQGSGGALAATGSTTVNITAVNDAPVNTVPGQLSAPTGADYAIAGLSVSDPDAASLTTTLKVDHGTLTVAAAGGAAVTGSGTGTVTLTGSVAQIDATLGAAHNVVYHSAPGFGGADTLTMSTLDDYHGSGPAGFDSDVVSIHVVQSSNAFGAATSQLSAFTAGAGCWTSQNLYPRLLGDIDGDGKADIVAFGAGGVSVSLATSDGHFASPTNETGTFGAAAGGWSSQDQYPRLLADVNGDHMADIVAFGAGGVSVSLASGNGHFAAATNETGTFGTNAGGWSSQDQYPRLLADVNGDGMADIIAFGAGGVSVARATGSGHFAAATNETGTFGFSAGGWTSQDQYPRLLGDVDGDGKADIVAFGAGGVSVARAFGDGHFAAPTDETGSFGFTAGGWTSQDQYPRMLADINGDHMADILGFGAGGVSVSLATGNGHFAAATDEIGFFGTNAGGWSSQDLYPRALGDVNGDGAADIIGFGQPGVYEALSNAFHLI